MSVATDWSWPAYLFGIVTGFAAATLLWGSLARRQGSWLVDDIRDELHTLRRIRDEHPINLSRFGKLVQRLAGGYREP